MRWILGLLFLLFCCLPTAQAQGVRTAAVNGLWTGEDPQAWWLAWDTPPFVAGRLGFHLPPGQGLMDWDELNQDLDWAGWLVSGDHWSNLSVVAIVPHFAFGSRWQAERFFWEFDPVQVGVNLTLFGPWHLGAGVLEASGWTQYQETTNLGSFQADARAVFAGWKDFLLLYGEAEASFSANYNLIILTPFQMEGRFHARVLGAWGQGEWIWGSFRLGLGAGAGVLWSDQGSWTVAREWLEFVPTWPFIETRTSRIAYDFRANPAWGLLLYPRVAWNPWSSLSIEVSRWIPWAGGWSLDARGPSDRGGTGEDQGSFVEMLSRLDSRTLWLAGLQVQLSYQW